MGVQENGGEPQGELTTRTLAMPGDANPAGDIFGGWVLAQMDIAGGICASERARSRVATVAIDGMSFVRPVHVGDVLCIYAEVVGEGRSSMKIHLEAWARRERVGEREKVTDAIFTFVSLDERGRSKPLPPAP